MKQCSMLTVKLICCRGFHQIVISMPSAQWSSAISFWCGDSLSTSLLLCCHIVAAFAGNGMHTNLWDKMLRSHNSQSTGAGHNLGGALGELAAYDIAQAAQAADLDLGLACYNFGAPRVGNHAFARDFLEAVPDTWNVINDQVLIWLLARWPDCSWQIKADLSDRCSEGACTL